ncbi:MAG: aa3-type cytochrome oxidase subunit CtaJ [Pseudonocardiaceae bacterium]
MTSWEIVLVLVGAPLAIMVLLGLLTMRSAFARPRRYRCGDAWNYPAVLWTAHPDALRDGGAAHHGREGSGGARGGARGNW